MNIETINICFIGEVSVGKTTLLSILLNNQCGQISRKRSTHTYNVFKENSSCLNFPIIEESASELSCCSAMTYDVPIIKFFGEERKYNINVIDSIGFNDNKFDDTNVAYYKSIEPTIDIVVIILDVGKCLCTNSEKKIIEMVGGNKLKIYLLNKYDDVDDGELIVFKDDIVHHLITNGFAISADYCVSMSGINIYNTLFCIANAKQKSLMQLHNADQIFEIYGYNACKKCINDMITDNLQSIFAGKIEYAVKNITSIQEICALYETAQNIIGTTLSESIDSYMSRMSFEQNSFVGVNKYLNIFDKKTIVKLVAKHVKLNGDYQLAMQHFGNNEIVAHKLIQISLSEIKNICTHFFDDCEESMYELMFETEFIYSVMSTHEFQYNESLQSDINSAILPIVKSICNALSKYESKNDILVKLVCYFRSLKNDIVVVNKLKMIGFETLFLKDYNSHISDPSVSNFDCLPYLTKCLDFENEKLCIETSSEIALRTVKRDVSILKYIPNSLKTYELCEIATHEDHSALQYISNNSEMGKLCKIAVKGKWHALKYVPDNLKTYELCELAVEHIGDALEYVPDSLKTYELCKLAVESTKYGCCDAFRYVPDSSKTYDLCKIAIERYGSMLKYVPEKLKTEELCKIAVNQSGDALQYVPENLKTIELCALAINDDDSYYAIRHVSDSLKTNKLCKLAIERCCDALEYVPENLKTEELCTLAIENDDDDKDDLPATLKYVPDRLKTLELCGKAVAVNPCAIKFVPDEFKFAKLCNLAVKQDVWMIDCIPDELKTAELCEIAVKRYPSLLECIPEKFKTVELCEIIVDNNKHELSLRYVPEELKTNDLCKKAVGGNGHNLQFVPWSLRNDELRKLAKISKSSGNTLEVMPHYYY